jgi:transcriptional regulator with XRE-family HTH domain
MDSSEFAAMTKEQRKNFVQGALTDAGVPMKGRQVQITRETGISKPTVQALLLGSMPRDSVVCLKFCDRYNIDFKTWVTGRREPPNKLVEAIALVREFERSGDIDLSNDKFAKLVSIALSDRQQASAVINNVIEFGGGTIGGDE